MICYRCLAVDKHSPNKKGNQQCQCGCKVFFSESKQAKEVQL